jgi:hypothetical protein
MKKYFILSTFALALLFVGCKETPYIDAPGTNNESITDTLPTAKDPTPTPDPEGFVVPEGTINIYEAVEIAKKLHGSEVSAEKYFIKGYVTGFNRGDKFSEDFPKYGNDFVYISATAPDAEVQSKKQFYAYRLLGKFGAKLPDLDCVKEGDFIVISCYLTNYGGVYESSGACFAYLSNNAHFNEVFPAFPGCPDPKEGEISVTEAERVALTLASKATSEETYKVRGVVTSVDVVDPSYGNATFNISDGLSYATCYRLKGKGNSKFTNANQVAVGDTVLVNAKIQNYNGTCEPTQGYVEESTNPNF